MGQPPPSPAFKWVHKILKQTPNLTIQAEQRLYQDPYPWRNSTPKINFQLIGVGRKKDNPWKLLAHIQELLNTQYKGHTHIYTDGSKQPQTNSTAAAVFIPSKQHRIKAKLPDGGNSSGTKTPVTLSFTLYKTKLNATLNGNHYQIIGTTTSSIDSEQAKPNYMTAWANISTNTNRIDQTARIAPRLKQLNTFSTNV
ncbi:hypothetical protein CHS0354_007078 [Potamilus streckersoni]|uniref:Uncharacterized protein n=1 Tax=Potamilus streckersoni TaxID=2493646 RepID=A0AAE0RZ20_9BIVA|nr:hypothetical protein CHS0354_007078 [Potamilus streckersoni]